MCGLVVVHDPSLVATAGAARDALGHRGPDSVGAITVSGVYLGHARLSILDLSDAGRQPMSTPDGRLHMVFNGEVYNYRELRAELTDHRFTSDTDSEVVLAALARWGPAALDRFIGMFAIAMWDDHDKQLWCARDRFGVKPLYLAETPGGVVLASEIGALQSLGLGTRPDETAWATYLATGYHEGDRTFWDGIRAVPAGHTLTVRNGRIELSRWYDLAGRTSETDDRSEAVVTDAYAELLIDSVDLRFRSDVPVGINLSGGLDSSLLLGTVHELQGEDSDVAAFTFTTGDPDYDELPWVRQMVAHTAHPLVECRLDASDVPELAQSVWRHQLEPYGGLPTLAYARLFERARAEGVIVLLDGQGMDEQWAGYDYYAAPPEQPTSVVQGTTTSPVRPATLRPEFAALAEEPPAALDTDRVRGLQLRDLTRTKIPRALRFNDRVSMRASTELREPFLDHRLVELALRQPLDRKICDGVHKHLPRRIAADRLPTRVVEAPKRPLQTPQREWLRGPLRGWAESLVDDGLDGHASTWLDPDAVKSELHSFLDGEGDNSFFVWQWMSLGMMERSR